jgi:hypothetical protein
MKKLVTVSSELDKYSMARLIEEPYSSRFYIEQRIMGDENLPDTKEMLITISHLQHIL